MQEDKTTEFNFWNWLGGLIDGDGCFSISVAKQHNGKTPRIALTPQVSITSRGDEKWYLEYVLKNTGVGKIYTRGKNPYPLVAWQTTNLSDGLYVAKQVSPYLILKKEKCEMFIQIVGFWLETSNAIKGKRAEGKRLRTNEEMKKIIKVACDINSNRQTRRYKDKWKYADWEELIDLWYPE